MAADLTIPVVKKIIKNFETKTGEKYVDQKYFKKYHIRTGRWTGEGHGHGKSVGPRVLLTKKMKARIKNYEASSGEKYLDQIAQKQKKIRDTDRAWPKEADILRSDAK